MKPRIGPGRPANGAAAPTLETLHVRLDADTLAALKRLAANEPGPGRGRRSVVVRRLIHEADAARAVRK
jgi:hypothetical protein